MRPHFPSVIRRWQIVWIIVLVVLAVALALFLFLRAKRPTRFSADIQARSISFKLGRWTDSAGVFLPSMVDLTLQTHFTIAGSPASRLKPFVSLAGQGFKNVRLLSMDTSQGLGVTVDVDEGLVIFNLTPNATGCKPLIIQLTEDSSQPESLKKLPLNEEITLTPENPNESQFEFSVRFRDQPASEIGIPLLDGSSVHFQKEGQSEILAGKCTVALEKVSQKLQPKLGLKLTSLQAGRIEELALVWPRQMQKPLRPDYLSIKLVGEEALVWTKNADGKFENKTPTVLAQYWPANLSSRIQAVAAILSFLAAAIPISNYLWRKYENSLKKSGVMPYTSIKEKK